MLWCSQRWLYHLFLWYSDTSFAFFCSGFVIIPSKQFLFFSFFREKHRCCCQTCKTHHFLRAWRVFMGKIYSDLILAIYKLQILAFINSIPLMGYQLSIQTRHLFISNAAHVVHFNYLLPSISTGDDQCSLRLSWKPEADTNPQQQDSPPCRHGQETERLLPRHGWKQVWREFEACGDQVFP